jgi:GNAT superfamily N-acetyltransferase
MSKTKNKETSLDIFSNNLFSNDDYKKEIVKVCDLHRETTPLVSKVELDEATLKTNNLFDFEFTGSIEFFPFKINEIIKNLDFKILVITGASGSGKSTFSRYFGEEEHIEWDNNKAIISNFASSDEAVEKLGAVGLNSIPTWCKPRSVLSVGEGFRADLARRLKSGCVIDEFTSTVDRNVAMSTSKSVSKYIRKNNLHGCVFVSCHKDFIDVLCPDYVIDLDDECVYDTRGLLQRQFELQVYEKQNKREIWNIFKQHHYLSADLNVASKMFVAYLNNEIVGMCAILPQPGVAGLKHPAWRVHRLVVLPDYQGLGIATKLLEYVCDLYAYQERVIYLRTSHVKLIGYMKHSKKWQGSGTLEKSHADTGALSGRRIHENRLSTSFKYIAPCENVEGRKYDYLVFKDRSSDDSIQKQTLF